MTDEFHKPTQYSGDKFDTFEGGEDPAVIMRIAHDSAHALVDRARDTDDPAVVERLVAYTDQHGVDALAELWARSSPKSLPGALWRIYLIRVLIRQDPDATSYLFQRGSEVLATIDAAVAGAPMPTGPEEITALADQILRGLFTGDFAVALDRAAAFSRVMSAGATSIADDADVTTPQRGSELTTRALRFTEMGEDLTAAARLHRAGSLE
ncbi:DNA-directed RNA polymerase subunit beta [Glaciihabitans arcticus]|uniref:DNA-directed RNA polymerase subunit beta n=1 Tax=Glaciihabitans arcticus TaxID=2668039 RepID=A0A4Q9GY22_9MICO|nr:DNA-directed RNA polymerase subunit beta [Glaciihabitans arcticus]TBN57673.1 DNA-directed RNA polymerase subunit beta [Glaciihabitans arcticus]